MSKHCIRIVFLAVTVLANSIYGVAAKQVTVTGLVALVQKDMAEKESDERIADDLRDIELSEQLSAEIYNSLVALKPGHHSVEQLTVLLYASALQPVQNPSLVNRPEPKEVEVQALIGRALAYANNTFSRTPDLLTEKTIIRLDNRPDLARGSSEYAPGKEFTSATLRNKSVGRPTKLRGVTSTPVRTIGGVESLADGSSSPETDPKGPVFTEEFGGFLPKIVRDASDAGTLHWKQWDIVSGVPVGVLSFAIAQEKSHVVLRYCCFPETDILKGLSFVMAPTATWKPSSFQGVRPYHGLIFVEPHSGSILRMIVQAELKPTDSVLEENTRVDYATVKLGSKSYLLPKEQITLTRVVATGDAGLPYLEVRRMYAISYSGFKLRP